MKLAILTTPENKHFAFNVPNESNQNPVGFYQITDKFKEANKHIDFDYLAHDLEFRGVAAKSENPEFKIQHIRAPMKQKSDNWQETADAWAITCKGITFDYYTGIGHRVMKGTLWHADKLEYKRLKNANLTECGFTKFLELTKPVAPKPTDLIYSLIADASACEESFEDWCSNFGYETDSRKALETYLACQASGEKLRKLGLKLDILREALQDY
jgi:hypothetical protein